VYKLPSLRVYCNTRNPASCNKEGLCDGEGTHNTRDTEWYADTETNNTKRKGQTFQKRQNVIFQHPFALYSSDLRVLAPSKRNIVHCSFYWILFHYMFRPNWASHDDGRPTCNKTYAAARTLKAATTSKSNKTISNRVQPT
jgi:hypothetical protein